MTQKIVRRLGERLNHIFRWVDSAQPYDTIWDVCCDHGRLGLHLHKRHLNAHVYLVDKVAAIIDQVVEDFGYLDDGRLSFITADARELEALEVVPQKRTLVIIAGVGGNSLITMLEGVLTRLGGEVALDFMLSPNCQTFELREFLRGRPFCLIDEAFVTEKKFSHEHFWVRYDSRRSSIGEGARTECVPVSTIGDGLWKEMTDTKRAYVRKLLCHYQRMLDNRKSTLAGAAIKAYTRLL